MSKKELSVSILKVIKTISKLEFTDILDLRLTDTIIKSITSVDVVTRRVIYNVKGVDVICVYSPLKRKVLTPVYIYINTIQYANIHADWRLDNYVKKETNASSIQTLFIFNTHNKYNSPKRG